MWASVAAPCSHGMSTLHVCVDCNVLPFGNVIVMGWMVIFLFVTWAPSTRKWLVAHELLSAVASLLACGCGMPCWVLWWASSLEMDSCSSSSSFFGQGYIIIQSTGWNGGGHWGSIATRFV